MRTCVRACVHACMRAYMCVRVFAGSVLIHGGETTVGGHATPLADTWTLGCTPAARDPVWTRWKCGVTPGGQAPLARSCHAAVAAGEHLLVFGGWAAAGADHGAPLGHPELLHLATRCWKHCSTVNAPPPPRASPTLVYSRRRHLAILHGGRGESEVLGDTWCLDLESWIWHKGASVGAGESEHCAPAARAEHTAVLWPVSSHEERMLVFGGSTLQGASAELWSLDCSSGAPAKWSWNDETHCTFTGLAMKGPSPPARCNHAAAITGYGASASLVICGGQGQGGRAVLSDAWVLTPLGSPERTWQRLDLGGAFPLRRSGHALALLSGMAVVYGGHDGATIVDAHHSLFAAPLDLAVSAGAADSDVAATRGEERPVTVDDLPEEVRAKAAASTLPLAMAKALHRFAVTQDPPRDTYIDPESGYSVFTNKHLKRRPCCGNGCRHCPWGHENVPEYVRKRFAAQAQGLLEW